MARYVFAIPIPAGNLDKVRQLAQEFTGARRQDFEGHVNRIGLTHQEWWITPDGERLIVANEGEEPAQMLPKFAASDHPFDAEWRQAILSTFGMDITQPPPGPMTESLGSWGS